jgi:tRNA G46 methylase TrmB
MATVVEEIAKQNPDLKVVSVDVDGDGIEPVLKKYGVRAVPTFVHLRGGATVRSASGTISKADLSSLIKEG